VRLSEETFATAETPRDLLSAVLTGHPRGGTAAPELADLRLGAASQVPEVIDTLPGVLTWRAEHDPDRTHVLLYETDATAPASITYGILLEGA
jgi:hypothetical protein